MAGSWRLKNHIISFIGKAVCAALAASVVLTGIFAVHGVSFAEPLRVVSLYPGHTDNIIALGGGDMLVGISDSDDPDVLPNLPRLSVRTGAEAVIALRPDVVLTRSLAEQINPNLSKVLAAAGIRVEVTDPPEWESFPAYLDEISRALNLDADAALERLENIKKKISGGVPDGSPRPRVFVEATSKELRTCSPTSWAARLIELAGGINAASGAKPLREGSALAECGVERVMKIIDDGIDLYIVQRGAMNADGADKVLARPWGAALRDVRIEEIPESLLSRPSLLGLERGGELLLRMFYGSDM